MLEFNFLIFMENPEITEIIEQELEEHREKWTQAVENDDQVNRILEKLGMQNCMVALHLLKTQGKINKAIDTN